MSESNQTTRQRAINLINKLIERETGGIGLHDLADTPIVMNAIDDISSQIDHLSNKDIINAALSWAYEILDDEGFLFD